MEVLVFLFFTRLHLILFLDGVHAKDSDSTYFTLCPVPNISSLNYDWFGLSRYMQLPTEVFKF